MAVVKFSPVPVNPAMGSISGHFCHGRQGMDELIQTLDAKLLSNLLATELDYFLGLLVNGPDAARLLKTVVFLVRDPIFGIEKYEMHNETVVKPRIVEMLLYCFQVFFVQSNMLNMSDELAFLIQDFKRDTKQSQVTFFLTVMRICFP